MWPLSLALICTYMSKTGLETKKLKIDKCIGCGLCSYICPAKIEVREILNKIKVK